MTEFPVLAARRPEDGEPPGAIATQDRLSVPWKLVFASSSSSATLKPVAETPLMRSVTASGSFAEVT